MYRDLYQTRLSHNAQQTPIRNNVNQEWANLRAMIFHATLEALGTRRKRCGNRGLRIWNDDITQIIGAKKQAYLKHLPLKTDQTRSEYNLRCAITRRKVSKIKRNICDSDESGTGLGTLLQDVLTTI